MPACAGSGPALWGWGDEYSCPLEPPSPLRRLVSSLMIRSRILPTALATLVLAAPWLSGQDGAARVPVAPVTRHSAPDRTPAARRAPVVVFAEHTELAAAPVEGPEYAPPVGEPHVLACLGGSYRPEPGLDPRLLARWAAEPAGRSFAFVMIEGRMTTPERLDALRGLGCRILGVHTWQCFVVDLPHTTMRAVEALPFVRWVGLPLDAQKIDPRLAQRLLEAEPRESLAIQVSVHASDLGAASVQVHVPRLEEDPVDPRDAWQPTVQWIPNGPIQQALEREGFEFAAYFEVGRVHTFRGRADRAVVGRLAALHPVASLEPYQPPVPLDDQSMTMVGLDRVRGDFGGEGITAGVVDTGFQGGTGRHSDLNKFTVGWSNVTGGPFVDNDGHGTHMLGTLAGTGAADQRYVGAAPGLGSTRANRLFVGRLFDSYGVAQGDFRTLFNAMSSDFTDTTGVVSPMPQVINDSWGVSSAVSGPGAYYSGTEAEPRFIDDLIYTHKQLHVFAAGNQGAGVTLHGAAKNALTVGAVRDNQGNGPVGSMVGNATAGTADSRRKPEIVAPGSLVTATSHLSTTGYATRGGSSPAAPHVTGALAGLIQHYPSELDLAPHALKAIVAATAQWQSDPGIVPSTLTQAEGFGMLQAHRMHGSTDDAQVFWGIRRTPFTFTRQATSWDFTMPADLTAARVVLAWIEPAASAAATFANVNQLECWLDVEPFIQQPDLGDFRIPTNNYQTMIALASDVNTPGGFAEAAVGKQVRVKVVGLSVPTEALPAVAIVAYTDETYATGPVHELTVDDTAVQPSAQVEVTASLTAPLGADEFENGRIEPVFANYTVLSMERTTADGKLHRYVAGTPAWPSAPYPGLVGGMVVGSGTARDLRFLVQAPATEGIYALSTNATAEPAPDHAQRTVQVCVDGSAPDRLTGLASTSHTPGAWSNVADVDFTWNIATDVGCAGVQGIGFDWRQGGSGTPTGPSLLAQATFLSLPAGDTATVADGWTLTLRSYDEAGNESALTSFGPFLIDTEAPSMPMVQLAGGAAYTGSLTVPLRVASSDAQSGVAELRLSADGTTWSGWQVYPSGSVNVDLSAFGGTALEGTKQVFVEVRDVAGNVSAAGVDDIEYLRVPTLGAPQIGSAETVGPSPLVLTGTDLVGVQRVAFGGLVIDSQSVEDFVDGWFEVTGDTRIEVHPPQGLAAGSYPLRVENRTGRSNPQPVQLVHPTRPVLLSAPAFPADGSLQAWVTHHGGAAGTIASYLVLSPLNTPSRLPGIVDLGLGGGFSLLFVVEPAALHDPLTGAAVFAPLPIPASLAGTSWFAQALQVDLGNLAATPIPVTNVVRTGYR